MLWGACDGLCATHISFFWSGALFCADAGRGRASFSPSHDLALSWFLHRAASSRGVALPARLTVVSMVRLMKARCERLYQFVSAVVCVSAFFVACVSVRSVQVVAETAAAAQNVGTLGVALTTCTLPGQRPSSRLDADTIEVHAI